jgi:hypothetical protein
MVVDFLTALGVIALRRCAYVLSNVSAANRANGLNLLNSVQKASRLSGPIREAHKPCHCLRTSLNLRVFVSHRRPNLRISYGHFCAGKNREASRF